MTITVTKNTKPDELEKAFKKMQKSKNKGVSSFYGKLQGVFGDGLAYQKKLRDEWS